MTLGSRKIGIVSAIARWLRPPPGWAAFCAIALIVSLRTATCHAASSQTVDIHVSLNASKSLSVNATSYNYGALGVNVSSVSSAIVVTNDSGSLVETYRIQGGNALSDAGGQNWTLASSPGTDQYALGAQFSSAQPANAAGSWSSDDLTASAITCTATQFGNGTSAESGASVSPTTSPSRNLWFRIQTPTEVTDPSQHSVTVTLSVL